MNKFDLKQEYENIKISREEKNKIYNSIMMNRKKRFNWIPILSLGASVVAVLTIFFLVKPSTLMQVNNPILNENIALENNYRKEIVTNALSYLNENKIDVTNLNNNEEMTIDSKDIIDKEEYASCSGNLIIKRYNDDYEYTTDVSCGSNTNGAIEYKIYDGFLKEVFEIENDIAIFSYTNYTVDNTRYVTDADANITLFNDFGDVLWNKKVESPYKDEDSIVDIKGISKVNNKYFIIIEYNHNYVKTSENTYHNSIDHYMMILDENGKELDSYELKTKDDDYIVVEGFIGIDDNTVYYYGHTYNDTMGNNYCIIKFTANEIVLSKYDAVYYEPETERTTSRIIKRYADGYFYGYTQTRSNNLNIAYNRCKTVFKLDSNGNIVWEKDIEIANDSSNSFIEDIMISGESLYIVYNDNFKYKLIEYSIDFEQKNIYDYSKYVDSRILYKNISVNDEIVFTAQDFKENELYFFKLDKNFQNLKKSTIDNENVNSDFMWSHIIYMKEKYGKPKLIYAANEKMNLESILLVFYQ